MKNPIMKNAFLLLSTEPSEKILYKKIGNPTTNQISRAPNKKTLATDNKFIFLSFEKTSNIFTFLFIFEKLSFKKIIEKIKMKKSMQAIKSNEFLNPKVANNTHPTKNPNPLTIFFDPVKTVTHLNKFISPLGARSLTADLDDIFVKSLATPLKP